MHERGAVRSLFVFLSLTLAAVLAGCGGGGGGATSDSGGGGVTLPLMVDSFGREIAEADFGVGDAAAAGADGTAFDSVLMENAQVTLTDSAGTSRTANTDASGYYRLSIKGLTPPFIARVKRGDGTEWLSASTAAVKTRGFITINLSGLTDKTLGHVADGAASAVTPAMLAANPGALVSAKARIATGLAAPLSRAGIDPAGYDPVSTPLAANGPDTHATFLSGLTLYRNAQGRTAVMGTVAGDASAVLAGAQGVAVDAAGNLVVADTAANVVRRISVTGVVTTIGTGEAGFSNGPAATATFNYPAEVATDAAGNIYVGDVHNNAIRKIGANGTVSTLAATAPGGWATSLAPDAAGGVYFVSLNVGAFRASADGTVTSLASVVPTTGASGVALDAAGNLYVARAIPRRIVRITPAGTVSDVYAPAAGSPGFEPGEITVDAAGNVYSIDYQYNRIWKVTPAGIPSLLAGGQEQGFADGTGPQARFGRPGAVAVDAGGNVLVADWVNNAVRKITPAGVTTSVAGNLPGYRDGNGALARFSNPAGVAIDRDGAILVADSGNHAIRKISPTGAVSTVAGTGAAGFSNGNALAASFNGPVGVAVDANGNVYVGDRGNNAIRKIGASGEVSTVAGTGEAGAADGNAGMATFNAPTHLALDMRGDIYLSDHGNRRMRRISADTVSTIGGAAPFDGIVGGIVADSSGTIFFKSSDPTPIVTFMAAIFSVAPDGTVAQHTPNSPGLSSALGIDGQGNFYHHRSLGGSSHLVKLSPALVETDLFQHAAFESGSIAVDRSGNIVVSDGRSAAIKIVLP